VLELPGGGLDPPSLVHWSDPLALVNFNPLGGLPQPPPSPLAHWRWVVCFLYTSTVNNILAYASRVYKFLTAFGYKLFFYKSTPFTDRKSKNVGGEGHRPLPQLDRQGFPPDATYSARAWFRSLSALDPLAVFEQFEHFWPALCPIHTADATQLPCWVASASAVHRVSLTLLRRIPHSMVRHDYPQRLIAHWYYTELDAGQYFGSDPTRPDPRPDGDKQWRIFLTRMIYCNFA